MGTDISPTNLRGLGIPLDLGSSNILSALATYTEANVVSGTAAADPGAKLVLGTAGVQEGTFEIVTHRGGTAGEDASFVWKLDTDPDYYGHDGAQAITDYQMLQIGTAIPSNTYYPPSGLATARGDVLVAYQETTPSSARIVVQRRGRQASSFGGAVSVYSSLATTAKGIASYPAMCELLDGSILLVHWVIYTMTGEAQLIAHRSTDFGDTWQQISTGALDAPVNLATATIGRTHLAQSGGQVLLICSVVDTSASSNHNCILQAASIDEGASFQQVGTIAAKEFKFSPALIAMDEGFGLAYISANASASFVRIPHAYYDVANAGLTFLAGSLINSGLAVAVTAGPLLTQGGLAVWRDGDGFLYALMRTNGATTVSAAGTAAGGAWWLAISADNGETWKKAGGDGYAGQAMVYNVNDNSTSLADVHGVAGQGRSWLFHRFEAAPGTADNSICATCLGGYNTINLPERAGDALYWQRGGYTVAYLPGELPADTGIFTTTGAGAQTIGIEGLQVVTTAAQARYYTLNPSPVATNAQGAYARFTVRADSGGSIGFNERGFSIRLANGSYEYEAVIRVSTTQIRLYDQQAGATIATATASGFSLSTTGASIFLAVADGRVSAWYRPADHISAFRWTQLAANHALIDGGAGAATNQIRFGHLVPTGGGVTSQFREVLVSYGADTGAQLAAGFDPVTDLVGRTFPPAGRYVYLDQGLMLTTTDGPALEGMDYSIAPRSDYGIGRVFHPESPSPQNGWRSAAVASGPVPEQFIPLAPVSLSEEVQLPSDLLYLHLEGINWHTATVEGYDADTASWTTLATVDTSSGLQLDGARRYGDRVSGDPASAGGGDQPYLFFGELQGWTCRLGTGGTARYRRIASNSEGSWGSKGGSKGAVIHLQDSEATDPSGPTPLQLYPSAVTVAVSLNGATYSAFGLRIASQETPDNDIRIGHLSLGSVFVLAPQYGRGRSMEFVANTELFEQPDGIIRTRKRGPGRRVFGISWTEPVDTSQYFPFSSEPQPDYYKASATGGSPAVANYGDGPYSMLGLWRELGGAHVPVTFLPDIPYSAGGAADVRVIQRRAGQALVMVGEAVSIDNVVGEEFTGANRGEAFRIGSVTLTEVI